MKENSEEKIIQQINSGLDYMDSKLEVRTPDMDYFRYLVSTVEQKKKVRSRREFLVFFIIALALLSSFTFAYYKYSIAFLAIQMLSVLFIPIGIYSWFRRQRKQVSE